MTSERSKRRDFLSLIFISKSISKKLLIKLKNFKIGLILLLNKMIVKISDLYDMLMPNFVSSFYKGKVQL